MIRAFVFDFGQTLVDSASGFRAAEKEAEKKIFSALNTGTWEDFLETYRRVRKEFHGRSNFSRKALWAEVCRLAGKETASDLLEQWETEYWDLVKTLTVAFPETTTVLDQLKKKYRLALISNTQGQRRSSQHRLSQFPQLEKYFELIIIAGENGIPPKPAPDPFQLGLEKLGLKPEQAIYIGDDFRIDIGGATAVGMPVVWLQHHSVKRHWPEVVTTVPIICSLEELLDDRLVNRLEEQVRKT